MQEKMQNGGTVVTGNIVNLFDKTIKFGKITVQNGKIIKIEILNNEPNSDYPFISPGFVDAHVHIESSMLLPSEFARLAVVHGTVGVVCDPHEITNVCGIKGIRYMIENSKQVPFYFNFGVPSAVPVTPFETAGAELTIQEMEELYTKDGLNYLGEVMNFVGVLHNDERVMAIVNLAKKYNKLIDGHAPGLRGPECKKYIETGISTDHECFEIEEALEKIAYGMKIQIREGSAAKNYNTLHKLLEKHSNMCMFCSDDRHPDDLVRCHINALVKTSVVEHSYNVLNVLTAACLNPVLHYNLQIGLLREGDSADFIIIDNFTDWNILATYIKGIKVAEKGKSFIQSKYQEPINNFKCSEKKVEQFKLKSNGSKDVQVIVAYNSELITKSILHKNMKQEDGCFVSDIDHDILKIAVVCRYKDEEPAIGFITNFGIKRGAIASSIAHDSHNIVAVGVKDEDICRAVNEVIKCKGGIAVVDGDQVYSIALPVAGLMSNEDGYEIAKQYTKLNDIVKQMGGTFLSPFMTLSFQSLLVIPGLLDAKTMQFTQVSQ